MEYISHIITVLLLIYHRTTLFQVPVNLLMPVIFHHMVCHFFHQWITRPVFIHLRLC